MIRGLYTSASSMLSLNEKMNVVSNNLANVSTVAYKGEEAIMKQFPTMLIKMQQDFVSIPPKIDASPKGLVSDNESKNAKNGINTSDKVVLRNSPTIGKLGTGVELNESFIKYDQGSIRQTGSQFDLALENDGFFAVMTPKGERYTRAGNFTIGQEGYLETMQGYPVLDENGNKIEVKQNNFKIDRDGSIYTNSNFDGDKSRLVSEAENDWSNTKIKAKLKIVNFENRRYIKKEGQNLFVDTPTSGKARLLSDFGKNAQIRQGFLESSNVNPIREMVKMIELQRNYEASQKVIQTQDTATEKLFANGLKV